MRTIRTKVFKFDELTTEGQEKAMENLSDINIDFEWWKPVYEDAERIGLKITGFDIDRGSYCKGEIIGTSEETARLIMSEHGKDCETVKTAKEFLVQLEAYQAKADGDQDGDFETEIEELEEDFLKSICEDYRIMLQKEFEYQTSEEAIIETIEANEYEFYANGKLI